ncbi:hypothetical protein K443DRAFT_275164 [Laccaria amethystina LaAM-08-1]|uniref:Unplaced genomic scaffold K443scaffold_178, whole genome shotgun sequence n=1 Tax=Laccaria amethystina LaAM-08-1 TaxID=1095629 RepID=A0A0C9WKW1_9AGAR|nr:hypothetical protein K443DRAFT_275164 [Laccaria amethystina LaAM-08-1]
MMAPGIRPIHSSFSPLLAYSLNQHEVALGYSRSRLRFSPHLFCFLGFESHRWSGCKKLFVLSMIESSLTFWIPCHRFTGCPH